jgi:hypothetical protein
VATINERRGLLKIERAGHQLFHKLLKCARRADDSDKQTTRADELVLLFLVPSLRCPQRPHHWTDPECQLKTLCVKFVEE